MVKVMMKLIAVAASVALCACGKSDFGSYQPVTTVDTVVVVKDPYVYAGVLSNDPGGTFKNEIYGTRWVLVKMVSGLASTAPNDTVYFINNSSYRLNQGAALTYQLSGISSSTNKSLSLNFFAPFGGSNYSGQVGEYFVSDKVMSNIEFYDVQNSATKVKAWFVKI